MNRKSFHLGAIAMLAAVCATGGACSSGGPSAAAGASSSNGGFVQLTREAHPLARPELDRGPLDPGRRLENLALVFKASAAQVADREALKAALVDPSSPVYHQWLTPEQYAARFGAQPADIARATAWLASQGLEVKSTSRLGTRVNFGGTVAAIQSAFHTEMHRYEVGGEMHYAMATAPSVPADLADVVVGLHNSHDFYPRPMVRPSKAKPLYDDPSVGDGLAPPDWAAVYDVAPLYTSGVSGSPIDGTGVTIGIVGVAQIAQSDVDAFRTQFGLPAASPIIQTLVPGTGPSTPGQNGGGVEAMIDVEWSGGIAKGAQVNYVYIGGDDQNVDDATYYAIEEDLAPIVSESFGGCELDQTTADADLVATNGSAANILGITYLAASGDSGAAGCIDFGVAGIYADEPASYPGVTAVGGTEFPSGAVHYDSSGDATGYGSIEDVWMEGDNPQTGVGAGGGGISIVFARPTYQSAVSTCAIVGSLPDSTVNPANMRQEPDLAFTAASENNPYFVECSPGSGGDCNGTGGAPQILAIGGTSCAAPSFAGVVALMNQAAGGRLGNINPMLYTLASTTPSSFHDVTTGSNEIICKHGTDVGCPAGNLYGYAAATGYDCASGLGSMDVAKYIGAVAALTPTTTALAATPTTTTEGAPIALSATVDVNGSNSSALGGIVTFAFQSYQQDQPDLSWTIGTASITGGSTTTGTAGLASAVIPVGFVDPSAQYVDVVAMYGGDANHLPSTSAKVRITFTGIDFAIAPTMSMIAPGGSVPFTSTGGVPPVQWLVGYDSTCNNQGTVCSTISASGAYVAGPEAGYAIVYALDSNSAEAIAYVTVGSPTGIPPWDDAGAPEAGPPDAGKIDASSSPDSGGMVVMEASTPMDASSGMPEASTQPDAGQMMMVTDASDDGSSPEASMSDAGPPSGSSSGCACTTAGSQGSAPAGLLGVGALVLGLAGTRRRRR